MGLALLPYETAGVQALSRHQIVAWVFRPFAMQHPETAWAVLEAMVQRVRDAEAR